MARIVAGTFDDQPHADDALARLRDGGIAEDALTSFVVNPAGMHNALPAGGDEDADPQARGGEDGAVAGAAIGGAAGIAAGLLAAPLVGPVGVAAGMGAGAYVGALAGAARAMGDDEGAPPATRPAGIVVAVRSDDQLGVAATLKDCGAKLVEIADGQWADGQWRDFDATRPPERVVATSVPAAG